VSEPRCGGSPTASCSSSVFLTFIVSSYVSSSTSTVVIVSSTSPRTMFKCWSYACDTRSAGVRRKSESSELRDVDAFPAPAESHAWR